MPIFSQLYPLNGQDPLSVMLPAANIHTDAILQRIFHVLTPLYSTDTAPSQIILPADVKKFLRGT
jgi:hypothetical protein